MNPTPLNVFYTYEENNSFLSLYRYELLKVEVVPTDWRDETQATHKWLSISLQKSTRHIEFQESEITDENLRGIPCDGTAYAHYAAQLTARANGDAS